MRDNNKNLDLKEQNAQEIAEAVIENNRRRRRQEVQKQKQREKTIKRVKVIGAIALAATIGISLVTDREKKIEVVETPISNMYYMVEDPSQNQWALVNAVGQEEMTNERNLPREEARRRGASYDPSVQAGREAQSVQYHEEFLEIKSKIGVNMNILRNPESTQEQLKEAITELKTLTDRVQTIYARKQSLVEEAGKGFEKSSKILPDTRTESEIDIKDNIVAEYKMELGLSQANVDFINSIYERVEAGEELNIDMLIQAMDKDYLITGYTSREVVKETNLRGISAILRKFTRLFEKDKTPNEQIRNEEEQTQNDTEER